jgi:hypothetical protein
MFIWLLTYKWPLHFILFIYFAVLGSELKAYTLNHSSITFFVKGFFETGSCKLFAEVSHHRREYKTHRLGPSC